MSPKNDDGDDGKETEGRDGSVFCLSWWSLSLSPVVTEYGLGRNHELTPLRASPRSVALYSEPEAL